MTDAPLLRVIRLTPHGRGAVATILVEGPGALALVERCLCARSGRCLGPQHPQSDENGAVPFPRARLRFKRFGSSPGEQVVVRPRGEDCVELHCHGGLAAAAMIQRALAERGCQAVAWQDWLAHRPSDPIAAAARAALAEARTERAAAILLDQHQGALRRAFDEIEAALARRDFAAAKRTANALLARADVGRHLVRPWRVVLAGCPNVGKSSLVNAILGYPRAIVHPMPGTTRDAVSATTAMNGWPVELCDTAGLRLTDDEDRDAGMDDVERAGIERAHQRLSAADLVVLVFDRSVPWAAADQALFERRPQSLAVHNKCDLPAAPGRRVPGIDVSAQSGEGIESLVRGIAGRLVPVPPPFGAAVPFTDEHVDYLAKVPEGDP